jgi:BirA family biotin operon repressor/biotin-[acetyl-CoA-carboxylase] ligase
MEDLVDANDIRERLAVRSRRWREVRVLDSTPSTNADVAAAGRDGAQEGLVVATLDQRAGRGRLDRGWHSPPGAGLAVSVLLRPDTVPAARWPWLPLLAGVVVRGAVADVARLEATLKWPNDVLVDGRKVSGILLERVDGPAGPAAVVGMGVNVSMSREQLPVPGATSLAIEGAVVDPADLLVALLDRLGATYVEWCASGGDPAAGLGAEYAAACSTLGARVRVLMPDGATVAGTATGVDAAGRLRVDAGATTVVVGAGDVVHLRPGS